MIKNGVASLVILLLGVIALPIATADKPEERAVLQLVLNAAKQQPKTDVRVDVTVTNTSSHEVGWDGEGAVFLTWYVRTQNDERLFPKKLEREVIKNSAADRFVRLKPGQNRLTSYSLGREFRAFQYYPRAMNVDGLKPVNLPNARETWSRIHLTDEVKSISVQLEYKSTGDIDKAFERYFGYKKETVGVWNGESVSNKVTITLD
jgi:hypothetical protein